MPISQLAREELFGDAGRGSASTIDVIDAATSLIMFGHPFMPGPLPTPEDIFTEGGAKHILGLYDGFET